MEKLKKIDKLIFGALSIVFIVPELIWGMISKYWFYTLFGTRFDVDAHVVFISDPANSKFYTNILFLQFFVLLGLLIFVILKRQKLKFFTPIIVLLIALIGLGGIVLMFSYALSYVQYSIGL